MAEYKILTSNELAQKFIDNANGHIGIPSTMTPNLSKDSVIAAIESGWGFPDLNEGDKCVCYDCEMMNANGQWGDRPSETDMATFWRTVYNTTMLQNVLYGTEYVFEPQITPLNDMQLISEENVNIKGCCANLGEYMKHKVTVYHTGATQDTTVTCYLTVKKDNIEANSPSLVISTKNNTTTSFASPLTQYYDANPNDTTLSWHLKVNLVYPKGTYFKNINTYNFNWGSTTKTLNLIGTTGNTSSMFDISLTNKSINDIASVTRIGGFFDLGYQEIDENVYIDITDCRVPKASGSWNICGNENEGVSYYSNYNTTAFFYPYDSKLSDRVDGIPCVIDTNVAGKVRIKFNPEDITEKLETNTTYYLMTTCGLILTESGTATFITFLFDSIYCNHNKELIKDNNECYIVINKSGNVSSTGLPYDNYWTNGSIYVSPAPPNLFNETYTLNSGTGYFMGNFLSTMYFIPQGTPPYPALDLVWDSSHSSRLTTFSANEYVYTYTLPSNKTWKQIIEILATTYIRYRIQNY